MSKGAKILILLGFVCLFGVYPFAVYRLMGGWQETGVFGDTFGFVNSLVASITLVFVLSAFNIQKKQLVETQQALQLQQTPIMSLECVDCFLQFPYCKSLERIFPYPDSGLFLEIKNVSDTPIVNLEGRVTVELPNDKVMMLDEYFVWPILGCKGDSTEKQLLTIRTGDIDVLRRYFIALTDQSARPVLTCHFKYKNILGGCFEYKRVASLSAWLEGDDARKVLLSEVDKMNSVDLGNVRSVLSRQPYDKFWPVYHKCVSSYFDHTPFTYKGFQISQSLGASAVLFRAVPPQAYEGLEFLKKAVMADI